MGEIKLKIADLILDHDNPRITHAEGQQEALQKVVKDQKLKLVKLAQSISEHGLNPMDRLLVLRVAGRPVRFIALEGNRRVAVFKILDNPAVMTGLEMPDAMRKILERLAKQFARKIVEPISCFEMPSRQASDYWLELRHKGESQGAGIVGWAYMAQRRFRSRPPELQALDLVLEQGNLSAEQKTQISEKFPLSSLQRLVEDRQVRKALGIEVKKGKLVTKLPASEVIKPLKKMVIDLATKAVKVGDLMKSDQMLAYVSSFEKGNAPDLSKERRVERSVDEIPVSEFGRPARTPRSRTPDPTKRREVVPKSCPIKVTENRIAEIYTELRKLSLEDHRNAIAVMMRVFLELSIDHFMDKNGIPQKITHPTGREQFKQLDTKLGEVVETLVKTGAPKDRFAAVIRSLSVKESPLNVDLLHMYVHNRYATPSPGELTAAWNNAQPLLEYIWP